MVSVEPHTTETSTTPTCSPAVSSSPTRTTLLPRCRVQGDNFWSDRAVGMGVALDDDDGNGYTHSPIWQAVQGKEGVASELGWLVNPITDMQSVIAIDIQGWAVSTVSGWASVLHKFHRVIGEIFDLEVAMLRTRFGSIDNQNVIQQQVCQGMLTVFNSCQSILPSRLSQYPRLALNRAR